MGYSTRPGLMGQKIRTYWPDDTADTFYIPESATLEEIQIAVNEKWPDLPVTRQGIRITPEHIQTDCLGYDCYDSGDYTYFLKVTRLTLAVLCP
jgi:hypothetical protein